MPRARMNAPMNRNISGSANGANTSLAGATSSTTQADAPSSAVTGSGSASVTHSTTTVAMTAARRWASGESPGSGRTTSARKTAGARKNPTARRTLREVSGTEVGVHHDRRRPRRRRYAGRIRLAALALIRALLASDLPQGLGPDPAVRRRVRADRQGIVGE